MQVGLYTAPRRDCTSWTLQEARSTAALGFYTRRRCASCALQVSLANAAQQPFMPSERSLRAKLHGLADVAWYFCCRAGHVELCWWKAVGQRRHRTRALHGCRTGRAAAAGGHGCCMRVRHFPKHPKRSCACVRLTPSASVPSQDTRRNTHDLEAGCGGGRSPARAGRKTAPKVCFSGGKVVCLHGEEPGKVRRVVARAGVRPARRANFHPPSVWRCTFCTALCRRGRRLFRLNISSPLHTMGRLPIKYTQCLRMSVLARSGQWSISPSTPGNPCAQWVTSFTCVTVAACMPRNIDQACNPPKRHAGGSRC